MMASAADHPWELHKDPRMDAYYYGFNSTGVPEIDWVLHAVAVAGKGAHNTAQWSDVDDGVDGYVEGHGLRGESFEQAIQNAAEDAANSLRSRLGGD